MASTMFQLAYGYELENSQDHFLKEAEVAMYNILSAGMQTNSDFFVNIFPALSRVPDWLPGTGWKRTAREWGTQQAKAKAGPYEWVKARVASGVHQPSITSSLLQDHTLLLGSSTMEKEERVKEVGFTMFGGGTDTSAGFLVNLVAAMVSNPHAQAIAQQELDTVLGQGVLNLPSITDKERLPYIRNLIDEVFRLYPVIPLGKLFEREYLTRAFKMTYTEAMTSKKERSCEGYRLVFAIEEISLLVLCWFNYLHTLAEQNRECLLTITRAIGRDPRHYKRPEVFNPDRYNDPGVPRPPAFGWGRRKCPGIHFAETSVFITTALLLSVFSFSGRKDSAGKEVLPQIELERNSLMLELKPFDFELKPRSDAHYRLITGTIDE